MGILVMLLNHAMSSQVMSLAHRRFLIVGFDAFEPSKLLFVFGALPPGVERRSSSRLPVPDESTVTNSPANPHASICLTKASVALRSDST